MINSVEALADCIMRFEGWRSPSVGSLSHIREEGSRSWRNRNPGNLRPSNSTIKQNVDDANYRVFSSLADGWDELLNDIEVKLAGESTHKLTPENTLHDFFNIYAPALDKNDPQQYSRQIAMWLNQIYNITNITPDTKLKDISNLGK